MSIPLWVPEQAVQIIHDRQIARHGGAPGLRDAGLLQNVLQRLVNKWQNEQADLFECAAGYAFGIAKAHAFIAGNKRTAFVTSVTFLRLNGWRFAPGSAEGVSYMKRLASGEVTEQAFKTWLSQAASEIL